MTTYPYSPSLSERRLRLAILLTATVAAALLLLSQQPALAGEVHFDPESPAGKEYALPLDQAREEAAGAGKTDGPAGEKAPLFGEGVSSGGGGPQAGGGRPATGSPGNGPTGDGSDGQQQVAGPKRSPAAVAAALSGDDDGYAVSSAILWILAIAVLAGIAALLLRAVQRPRPT
jgi:hypothetical protein